MSEYEGLENSVAFSSIESPQLPVSCYCQWPESYSSIPPCVPCVANMLPIAALTSTPVIWAVWFSAMQLRCSIEARPIVHRCVALSHWPGSKPSFFLYTSLSLIIASRRFQRLCSRSFFIPVVPSTFSCFPLRGILVRPDSYYLLFQSSLSRREAARRRYLLRETWREFVLYLFFTPFILLCPWFATIMVTWERIVWYIFILYSLNSRYRDMNERSK